MRRTANQFSVGVSVGVMVPLDHEDFPGDVYDDALGWQWRVVLVAVHFPRLGSETGEQHGHHARRVHRQPGDVDLLHAGHLDGTTWNATNAVSLSAYFNKDKAPSSVFKCCILPIM